MSRVLASTLVFSLVAFGAAAQERASEVVSSWRLMCGEPGVVASEAKGCRVVAGAELAKEPRRVVALSFSAGTKKGDLLGLLGMPLGSYLAAGAVLQIDRRRPYKILFEVCESDGCWAGFPVPRDMRADLGKAKDLRLRVWTAPDRSALVRIPLAGLGEKLDRVAEGGR